MAPVLFPACLEQHCFGLHLLDASNYAKAEVPVSRLALEAVISAY